ncbi:MAG: DUF5916 domain-containing protein [Bacteroidota bacterium]|nr:DUF5916 domain-containing protein [Bacteroidota bacterium]
MKYIKIVGCAYLISAGVLLGGTSTKNIVASRCNEKPKIDGLLSEQDWKSAVPVAGFKQFDPEEGVPATEETSVRILYDDDALYIGVFCFDSEPTEIVKQLTRRDRSVQADRFSIMIDSYHDHSTAFLFGGSVSGVQSDGILSQDGLIYDVQWDAVWDFDAKILSDGWSAEFKIPFSVLRFSEQKDEYVWGINFRRYIARKKETVEWVMVPRQETSPGTISSVSKMGNLSGIVNIQLPTHIEILPYHVSKLNYLSQPKPFRTEGEYDPKNFGLDLKYGITPDLTMDIAVNPDFGQVEVDQAELNLTVFETLYPEKRHFFLEGSQIFSFGNSFDREQMRLLYSRRIGRQPTGYENINSYIFANGDTLTLGENAKFGMKPEITTILGAGKISGRINQNLEFGILSAVTDREEATIKGIKNESPPIMIEPRANYNVVRLRQNIFGSSSYSSIGFMATSTFKQGLTPALSGGVDWSSRLMGGKYGIDGYIAGSDIKRNSGKERGNAGRLTIGKLEGEHWLAFSGYDFSSEKFSIDDLGYFSQSREHGGYLQISYKDDHAAAPFYRYGLTGQTNYRWNWNGNRTLNRIEFEPAFEFRNFWLLTLNIFHEFPAYDDKNKLSYGEYTPPIDLYKRPRGERFLATLHTDSREPIMLTLQSGYYYYTNSARTYLGVLQTTIKPLSWMDFVPGFSFMKTNNEEAWLVREYTYDGFCLFGDREVDYYNFSLRGTITFTPKIGVQFFSQVFLLQLRYTNFKKLLGPEDLVPLSDYPNPNIDNFMKVFNANIVFRWEYLPGSTFFLVWTQARTGMDGIYSQSLGRDFWDTFRIPMDNVILAKISYWWSL